MPVSEDALLIIYYVSGTICMILNFLVVVYILAKAGCRTTPMKLVLYLHLALTIECIVSMPKLYIHTGAFCQIVGILRAYFGLVNVIAVFVLVLHYRNLFANGWQAIRSYILNYRERFIFLFPLIVLLPLIGKAYGVFENYWCELDIQNRARRIWAFTAYYLWIITISVASIIRLITTCVALYKVHPKLLSSMFSSTGVYVICSILSWIPRIFSFINISRQENTYLSVYFFGMGYFLIFVYKHKKLEEFERTAKGQDSECNSFFSYDIGLTNSMVSSFSVDRSSISSTTNKMHGDLRIGGFALRGELRRASSFRLSERSIVENNSIVGDRDSIEPVCIAHPSRPSTLQQMFRFSMSMRSKASQNSTTTTTTSPLSPQQPAQELPNIKKGEVFGVPEEQEGVISPIVMQSDENKLDCDEEDTNTDKV